MAVNLSPIWGAGAQLLDNSGNVLSGGKIYTYAAGTTTQVATYTDGSGVTAHSNPIVLNSAGRVPYEIWLTDGQNYKFVLKDSNDVLIGTWDNLSGINSNFIAYTNQQEIQTATAGQTVFNLTTMNYLVGTNSLSVFVDGVNQYGPGAQYAYEETDSNTVTFASGLHVGAEVKFTSTQIQGAGAVDASQVSYTYPAVDAVTQNVEERLSEFLLLTDFGADPTGTNASDDAFNAALEAAYANYNKTIYVPNGIYKLESTITITQGVMIVCAGSQGSNYNYGTNFVHYSNNDCFVWDGSGTAFAGTGGGLKNCLITKAAANSGGTAIKLLATGDNNRPGEMFFENVLVYGGVGTTWTHGLVIDGTACNTPGARGVRTVSMYKCRFADVSTAYETIVLNQATHFSSHGLAVDTGSGSAAGITLKGINDGIYMNALGCAGSVKIVANDASNSTNNLIIDGKIGGVFENNDTAVSGAITISDTGGILNKSQALVLVTAEGPAALYTTTSNISDVTGDGTAYPLAFPTEVFDTWGNWGGNTFNVTIAGKYRISVNVTLTGLTSSHTKAELNIYQTGSVAQATAYVVNPYAIAAPSGGSYYATLVQDTIYECASGDVLYANITVSNGTKVVDIYGAAARYSYIAIEYLGS